MQIDKTTLHDLSIFDPPDNSGRISGVFGLLDHCITYKGREMLRRQLLQPPATFEQLGEVQAVVRFFAKHHDHFTDKITNGTLVMVDKFFEDADIGTQPQGNITLAINGWLQKVFNKQQYFLTQFSITHVADLVQGCTALLELQQIQSIPQLLAQELEAMAALLAHPLMQELQALDKKAPYRTMARMSYRTRRELKRQVQSLIQHFALVDVWRSLALAGIAHGWSFPVLKEELPVMLTAQKFYHPLLEHPVGYDIALSQGQNILVLTGANMSGKTTYLRALGILALLAHLGCAVPAEACTISFLHGLVTNMHVEDNLMMGESYFLAEVKRMKATAEKIAAPAPQLVLMDELFKGTNVHDAHECTRAVVEGLKNHNHHLMLLSTHLYEVAQAFTQEPALRFAYFITDLTQDGTFKFTYQLKEGISNDRIGYRILLQEGVIDALKRYLM